jgi:flagella basal body P-ring formation protein FlgA
MPLMVIALLLAAPAAAPQDLDALRDRVAAFAAATPLVDPRLALPACPALALDWVEPARTAVRASCADPVWRIYVPVQRDAAARAVPAALLVRRGDIVTVHVDGPGFTVALEGVAEADGAAGGQVRVRNRASGEHVLATVGADGVLRVGAYNSGGGGR